MSTQKEKRTTGGKGNMGKFIERDPGVCAAGLPSSQPYAVLSTSMEYKLQDEVDALINDSIKPTLEPVIPQPRLRKPKPPDLRFAIPRMAGLVNPPIKGKFDTLIEDLGLTMYPSYWKKPLGKGADSVSLLPKGFDRMTKFGINTTSSVTLYDVVMPKISLPDKTPISKKPGVQTFRNYCSPPYQSDLTYGMRIIPDDRGTGARCALSDEPIPYQATNMIRAAFKDSRHVKVGEFLSPCDNISNVPPGYAFGKGSPESPIRECLSPLQLNPDLASFNKCLHHIQSVRNVLHKRFKKDFFQNFYLLLKHQDTEKTGWLSKEIVYDVTASQMIRFNPKFIEPLLKMWNTFDGYKIQYQFFVNLLNYGHPFPKLPTIRPFLNECPDFRTTYTEMVKPGQEPIGGLRAGLPSARYFDVDKPVIPVGFSTADLPQESDMQACLCPSLLSHNNVTHRDMYCKREPKALRHIFAKAGVEFTDEQFDAIWNKAKELHSQGYVCIETFRKFMPDNLK